MNKNLFNHLKNITLVSTLVIATFLFILLQTPPQAWAQNTTPSDATSTDSGISQTPLDLSSIPGFDKIDYSNPDSLSLPAKLPQIQEQVTTTVYPEIPRPNQDVRITAEAYGTDLNTHLIVWKVNGKEALKGIGEKVFRFTMGDSGVVTNVEMTISPKNAPDIVRNFSFTPIDVDILWEADTYTPPFYKGKALFSMESTVNFVALPNIIVNGSKLNNQDVVYKWKIDRKIQNGISGYGKNSMSYTGPIIYKNPLIQAEIYSANDPTIKGLNGTTINYINTKALVYEDNPRYGILFNKAIVGNYSMQSNEVKFSAFPYFFSTKNKNSSSAQYTWNLNSYRLNIPQDQNSAIFRRKDSAAGNSVIAVDVQNPNRIFQRGASGFNVSYDQKKSDNI